MFSRNLATRNPRRLKVSSDVDQQPQPNQQIHTVTVVTPPDSPEEEQKTKPRVRQHRMLLDEVILKRHSTRLYVPTPVPDMVLHDALHLASHSLASSITNTAEAWRLFLVTGDALERLKAALTKEASAASSDDFVAGPMPEAVLRNFDFFGAPAAAILCMNKELQGLGVLSVGMHLQTFLLALTEQGVGSCVQVSITGYPEVVRNEVGVPDDLDIVCGVAIGYEDHEASVNKARGSRLALDKTPTVWIRE